MGEERGGDGQGWKRRMVGSIGEEVGRGTKGGKKEGGRKRRKEGEGERWGTEKGIV